MSDLNFGWELVYKTAESSFTNKTDVLISFVHFFLIKNKWRCVGIGDDKTLSDEDKSNKSELLPEGWNQMDGVYKLRYICDDQLYIFHAALCDELVILNIIDVATLKATNCTLNLRDTVNFEGTTATDVIKNMSETLSKLNSELLEPVFKGTQKTIQTQTEKKKIVPDPFDHRPAIPYPLIDPLIDRRFPEVGRGDLDPFGRGHGSLLPGPGHPRLPNPLGNPPGARFDPFGPPGSSNRFDPNPDHFRPPNYDDMFM